MSNECVGSMIDLFSGAGGAARGFHQAGFRTVSAVENNWHAASAYRLNFGDVVHQRDITSVHASDLDGSGGDELDVVLASPPCEAFTKANMNRAKQPLDRLYLDPRGVLSLHAIRLIGDLSPRCFVLENVKQFVQDSELRSAIEYEFERVGYKAYFHILEGFRFGAASMRQRVFVSNIKLDMDLSGDRPSVTVEDAIGDMPDPHYPHDLPDHELCLVPLGKERKVSRLSPGRALIFFPGADSSMRNFVRLRWNAPAPTIMGKSRFLHPFEDRPISIREQARLMSFPDAHQFSGSVDARYNQVGEAVQPIVARAIAGHVCQKLGMDFHQLD